MRLTTGKSVLAEAPSDIVISHFRRSRDLIDHTIGNRDFIASIVTIADCITSALSHGGKILLVGNGGSASDAQHIAAEFLGRYRKERAPLAAIALTADTSALTSISNDYGFEQVFARQVHALARNGDVLIGISTSGKSRNVLAALQTARGMGIITVGFTKAGLTPMHQLCDFLLLVPSDEVALIQQVHATAAHAICGLVEQNVFGSGDRGLDQKSTPSTE